MRLIDADALHERVQETMEAGLIYSGMTIAEFIHALVDEAPTIDAEPVRRGYWKVWYHGGTSFSYTCSFCGMHTPNEKTPYCAYCGAKMEE